MKERTKGRGESTLDMVDVASGTYRLLFSSVLKLLCSDSGVNGSTKLLLKFGIPQVKHIYEQFEFQRDSYTTLFMFDSQCDTMYGSLHNKHLSGPTELPDHNVHRGILGQIFIKKIKTGGYNKQIEVDKTRIPQLYIRSTSMELLLFSAGKKQLHVSSQFSFTYIQMHR